jgi:hypothetical protein
VARRASSLSKTVNVASYSRAVRNRAVAVDPRLNGHLPASLMQ